MLRKFLELLGIFVEPRSDMPFFSAFVLTEDSAENEKEAAKALAQSWPYCRG
jgi:hypothetical protein